MRKKISILLLCMALIVSCIPVVAFAASDEITVIYMLNGGKNSSENPDCVEKNTGIYDLESPKKADYNFTGWYLDQELTKEVESIDSDGIKGNEICLYAGWKRVALKKPVNVQVETVGLSTIRVRWDEVAKADAYRVYRSKTGKAGSFSYIGNTTKLSKIDSGLDSGTTYYYKVKAVRYFDTWTQTSSFSSVKYGRTAERPNVSFKLKKNSTTSRIIEIEVKNNGRFSLLIIQPGVYISKHEWKSNKLMYYENDEYCVAGNLYYNGGTVETRTVDANSSKTIKYKLDRARTITSSGAYSSFFLYDGQVYVIGFDTNGKMELSKVDI